MKVQGLETASPCSSVDAQVRLRRACCVERLGANSPFIFSPALALIATGVNGLDRRMIKLMHPPPFSISVPETGVGTRSSQNWFLAPGVWRKGG